MCQVPPAPHPSKEATYPSGEKKGPSPGLSVCSRLLNVIPALSWGYPKTQTPGSVCGRAVPADPR